MESPPQYVTIAKVGDIPPGTCRTVDVQGIFLALCNVEGTYRVVDNTCPHAGGPLGEGQLQGELLVCPWHGWRFNVRTGERQENPEIRVPVIEVRVLGEEIQVKVPLTL
ncbi:MAG: Rieske (2Fe-2S) protein [Nitrospiraceae bacterium]|nr:Rieske (2Fe-2S) protein [Nitrospiraceae bacterium]